MATTNRRILYACDFASIKTIPDRLLNIQNSDWFASHGFALSIVKDAKQALVFLDSNASALPGLVLFDDTGFNLSWLKGYAAHPSKIPLGIVSTSQNRNIMGERIALSQGAKFFKYATGLQNYQVEIPPLLEQFGKW